MAATSFQDCQWVNQILKKQELALCGGNVRRPKLPTVPKKLRNVGDDKDYIPQFVSLGPYHHGKDSLQFMEGHKYRALHHAMNRSNHEVLTYLNSIKEVEEEVRACYEGNISLSSKEFVEMIVVDGIFILEIIRGWNYDFTKLGYADDDRVFSQRGISGNIYPIRRDMLLLENQIPLFVLDKILAINPDPNSCSVTWFAEQFFRSVLPMNFDAKLRDEDGLLHCLDVFRRHITVGDGIRVDPFENLSHCATELKEAGINFKRVDRNRFWDIKFGNRVLEIPPVFISDDTKSVFLNLIAFEQCRVDPVDRLDRNCRITSWALFMSNLIKSDKDVNYLRYHRIIFSNLGDATVVDVFNTLGNGVVLHGYESHLSKTAREVNEYYDKKWTTWKVSLKRDYFSNLWSVISLVAAVILLVLAFLQTIFTMYPYFKPRS